MPFNLDTYNNTDLSLSLPLLNWRGENMISGRIPAKKSITVLDVNKNTVQKFN